MALPWTDFSSTHIYSRYDPRLTTLPASFLVLLAAHDTGVGRLLFCDRSCSILDLMGTVYSYPSSFLHSGRFYMGYGELGDMD